MTDWYHRISDWEWMQLAISGSKRDRILSRRKYSFGNPKRYEEFIKNHILMSKPVYYGVCKYAQHSEFYIINLIDDLENPSHGAIAASKINRQVFLLWNDICWTTAMFEGREMVLTLDKQLGELKNYLKHGLKNGDNALLAIYPLRSEGDDNECQLR